VRNGDYEGEGQHLPIELPVAIGILHDTPDESRRVRLLDADGEERARLSGTLTYEEGEGWVRLSAEEGDGLVADLTIPLHPETRCTVSSDGTMTGTLPDGSMWMTAPHWG
jgi:hypothetical protein